MALFRQTKGDQMIIWDLLAIIALFGIIGRVAVSIFRALHTGHNRKAREYDLARFEEFLSGK